MSTRLQYEEKIKDRHGITRGVNDGNLTDAVILEVINDAMDMVAHDLFLNMTTEKIARQAGIWRYDMPDKSLRTRNLYYRDTGDDWGELTYKTPDRFLNGFDETYQTAEPEIFSVIGRKGEKFAWSTESAMLTNKFAQEFYVSGDHDLSDPSIGTTLIVYGANFGVMETGKYLHKRDIVVNKTDDSQGYLDYLDFTTTISSGTSTSATATTLVDTGKDFVVAGVSVGDVLRNTNSGSTSFCYVTVVAATTLTFTEFQGTDTFLTGGLDAYSVGTADKMVLEQYGTSAGGLFGGTDNQFGFTVSTHADTAVTITTDVNTGDTLTGTFDTTTIDADMVLVTTNNLMMAKIRSVSSTVVKIDYWIGGTPGASATVSFGTADQFYIESRAKTRQALYVGPTPNVTDVGVEKLMLLYVPTPHKPDSDDDFIEIDDKYREILLSAMFLLSDRAAATKTDADMRQAEGFYKDKVKDLTGDTEIATGQSYSMSPGAGTGSFDEFAVDGSSSFTWANPY